MIYYFLLAVTRFYWYRVIEFKNQIRWCNIIVVNTRGGQ